MSKRIALNAEQFRVRLPKAQVDPLEAIIPTQPPIHQATQQPLESTQKSTPKSTQARQPLRVVSSENPRKKPRGWPSRDEIQEFTFRMRDELKVKVQAEVPHKWQKELEDLAREMDVKKLELYRFILGEFLGKVKRKSSS